MKSRSSRTPLRAFVRGAASAFDLSLDKKGRIDRFAQEPVEESLRKDLERIGDDFREAVRRAR